MNPPLQPTNGNNSQLLAAESYRSNPGWKQNEQGLLNLITQTFRKTFVSFLRVLSSNLPARETARKTYPSDVLKDNGENCNAAAKKEEQPLK